MRSTAQLEAGIANCRGNSQRDTDQGGYGNVCDPDFDHSGTVEVLDFSALKVVFGLTTAPDQDLNGNGIGDPTDFSITKSFLGQPPGPSCRAP
jgi:hypothetical protein